MMIQDDPGSRIQDLGLDYWATGLRCPLPFSLKQDSDTKKINANLVAEGCDLHREASTADLTHMRMPACMDMPSLSHPSNGGDGHLAVFCVLTWLLHLPILKVPAWNNAMGGMAKRHDNAMGPIALFTPLSHGSRGILPSRDLQNGMIQVDSNGRFCCCVDQFLFVYIVCLYFGFMLSLFGFPSLLRLYFILGVSLCWSFSF